MKAKPKFDLCLLLMLLKAVQVIFGAESTLGKAYELDGLQLVCEISLKLLLTFNIPTPIAKLVARGIDMLPYNQMINPDLIKRMTMEDKPTPGALTFKDLYIEPTNLEADAIHFMRRFRSNIIV